MWPGRDPSMPVVDPNGLASGSRGYEESCDLTVVGTAECMEVGGSQFVGIHVETSTPRDRFAPETSDQVIGGDPAVAAVAVRERVDGDQAVMESHCGLVRFVGAVPDPCLGVLDQIADLERDLFRHSSDVGLPGAAVAGPLPDLVEHRLVEAPEVRVIEESEGWGRSTQQRLSNAALLRVVELAAGCDVRRNESETVHFEQNGEAVAQRCQRLGQGKLLVSVHSPLRSTKREANSSSCAASSATSGA